MDKNANLEKNELKGIPVFREASQQRLASLLDVSKGYVMFVLLLEDQSHGPECLKKQNIKSITTNCPI